MADQGLNSADLRARSGVGTLQKNGVAPSPVDPLEQAFSDKRKIAAARLMDSTVADAELDTLKRENDRLEQQIRQQQLREAAKPEQSTSSFQEFLMAQMEQTRAQLAEAQAEARQANEALLEARMGMLRAELQRVENREPPPTEAPKVDEFTLVEEVVTKARKINDMLAPPPQEPILGYDPNIERLKITADVEMQKWRLEFQERQWKLQEELTLKKEVMLREQNREDKNAESNNRFLNETAPKFLQLGQQFFEAWISRTNVTVAPAATPVASPQVAAQPQARPAVQHQELPAGIVAIQCTCGNTVYAKESHPYAICPNCLSEFGNSETPQENPVEQPA